MTERAHRGAATAAVFLASFLLFCLQLASGKALLPSAGGSPQLFAATLVFHTAAYFAACLAVHLAFRDGAGWAGRRNAMLLLLLPLLPLASVDAGRFTLRSASPDAVDVSRTLAAALGAPLLALSCVSPLLQRVVADCAPADRAYPLSAAGNAGCLLGVLAYPLVLERALDLDAQFRAAFLVYALLAALLFAALRHRPSGPRPPLGAAEGEATAIPASRRAGWILRAAIGAALLSAFTVRMTRDVAAVPFLWSLPLSAYLLSFVVAFRDLEGRWRNPAALASFAALAILAVSLGLNRPMAAAIELPFDLFALFAFCLVLHGGLVASRPGARGLTSFHLALAGGGALGTFSAGLLAPLLFDDHHEFPLSIVAFALLFAAGRLGAPPARARLGAGRRLALFLVPFFFVIALGLLSVPQEAWRSGALKRRSFHGTLTLARTDAVPPSWRDGLYLFSGRTIHGVALDRFPGRPCAYYAPSTGVGRLFERAFPDAAPRRVGIIGLGAGTLAAYARPGDSFTFYEIDPATERIADEYFPFLSNCSAPVEIVRGDARVRLAGEESRGYDLLVLDAFSGDAIPAHLLTREAFHLYRRHLAPRGLLALHLSNVHLSLEPVAAAGADALRMSAARLRTPDDPGCGAFACDWTVLCDDPARLAELPGKFIPFTPEDPPRAVWTDRFSDPLSRLRW